MGKGSSLRLAVVRSLGSALYDLHIECAEMEVKVKVKVKVKRGSR